MTISTICAEILSGQQQLHVIRVNQIARRTGKLPNDPLALAKLTAHEVGQLQFIGVCQTLLARAGAANDNTMAPEAA